MDTNLALASCDVLHLIDFRAPEWNDVNADATKLTKALANCDVDRRLSAADALINYPWLGDGNVDSTAPLDEDVLERLRRIRVDRMQALALRSALKSGSGAAEAFLKDADAAFDALDADRTGLVRRGEVRTLADASGLSPADLDLVFEHADLEGNGVVSRDEFRAALLATKEDLVNTFVDLAFETMDASRTGTITRKDVAGAARKLGVRLSENDVAALIGAHDAAGDGELSRDEFRAMLAAKELGGGDS